MIYDVIFLGIYELFYGVFNKSEADRLTDAKNLFGLTLSCGSGMSFPLVFKFHESSFVYPSNHANPCLAWPPRRLKTSPEMSHFRFGVVRRARSAAQSLLLQLLLRVREVWQRPCSRSGRRAVVGFRMWKWSASVCRTRKSWKSFGPSTPKSTNFGVWERCTKTSACRR